LSAPRVSVLLPARDAASTLGAALDSVRRQRFTDWECVVVDDGSADDTLAVARGRAERDARIRVLAAPRSGLVAALERGREACGGEYVARMDADDLMHRERLSSQAAVLDRRVELAAVGCHVRVVPRAGLTDGMARYERWINGMTDPDQVRREAFVECPVVHPTLMLRRELLDRHGYRDGAGGVSWPEDYDLVLRLLATGMGVGAVPRRLHLWRDRPDRTHRNDPRYGRERFTACKAHHLARGLLAGVERYVLWGHGDTGRGLRAALEREGRRPSHIVERHPGRLGQTIHGAPVIPPEALAALAQRGPLRLVASVAGPDARAAIRHHLDGLGLIETEDYVVAA